MASVNDYLKRAKQTGFVLTKFLDTAESSTLRTQKENSLNIYYSGGYEEAERVRAIIVDSNETKPIEDEFQIRLIEATFKAKNTNINHRHVLGTLMSFGFKREHLGDIIVTETASYIYVTSEMAPYITEQLDKINNIPVKTKILDTNILPITKEIKQENINVASLRLDAVIAKVLCKSRSDVLELISKGFVQVNHIEKTNPSYFLKENDLISIRHFGRITIGEVVATTKKDRLILTVLIQH